MNETKSEKPLELQKKIYIIEEKSFVNIEMEEEQIRTVENLELASCNSPVNFNCEKCKYSAKSSTGLKTHMKAKHVVDKKKKHKNIPQLDGFEDLNINDGAQTEFVCGKCDL